jgi:hypothetical protein
MKVARIILVGAAVGNTCGVLTLLIELGLLMAEATSMMNRPDAAGLGAASRITFAPYVALAGFILGALWQYRR